MKNELNQSIKGSNNEQNTIVVQGDYVVGVTEERVLQLIKDYCSVDKDNIIKMIKDCILSINENDLRQPDKRTFVPLLQQYSYSSDDEILKKAYQNLLKSSMDKNKTVHPSYVSIVSQLSSDEVKLLNSLPNNRLVNHPLINVRIKQKNSQHLGTMLIKWFSDKGFGVCDNPISISSMLENLERLKIIEIPEMQSFTDKTKYDVLKKHPYVIAILNNSNYAQAGLVDDYDHLLFRLTEFGVGFIRCCK